MPDEFLKRCDALRDRGLRADYVDTIRAAGALDLLALLEAMPDEQLRHLGTRSVDELMNRRA